MEVSADYRDGYMGTAYLSSQSLSDSGPGPEIYLKFALVGTYSVGGKTIDFSSTKGAITISTTDWGKWERPDYCNVSFSVQGGQPRNVSSKLEVKVDPKYISFVFSASPEDGTVEIHASQDEDFIKNLIIFALKGIKMVHETAISRVAGKI
ncbi:hypothetical protein HK405_008365 [Cladochytrium tenue]|nr:hypothetical protein HK405_008365 [Cladochytrium tenue]